jgi:hypothetical protein
MAEFSHHEVCHTWETSWRCDKHLLLITHLIHGWRFYRCIIERAATSHFRRY